MNRSSRFSSNVFRSGEIKAAALFLGRFLKGPGRPVSDRFAAWLGCAKLEPVSCARTDVPLRRSKVAIVTTAGFFVKGQEPFREGQYGGDFTYRIIPRDVAPSKLSLGKLWADRRLPLLDPNVLFPIARLKELKEEGVIGDAARDHYSFCAFCSDYGPLLGGSAREVARRMRYEGVDRAVVIPASVLSQEAAVLIQRVIEGEGLQTVSLVYSRHAFERLRPPRAHVLGRGSLGTLEEYLDPGAQKKLLLALLSKFEKPGVPGHARSVG